MKLNLKKLLWFFVLFPVLLTPLFSALEIAALFSNTLQSQTDSLTPVWLKVLKDLGFIGIILTGFVIAVKRGSISRHIIWFSAVCLVTLYLAILTFFETPQLAAAGLRWALPVVAAFFLLGNTNEKLFHSLAKILLGLFFIQILVQTAQLFLMGDWYGKSFFGLSARNPGFFLIPNSGAFFSILCLFFVDHFLNIKKFQKTIYSLISISVFLTGSGTGIIIYFLYLCLKLVHQKNIRYLFFLFPALALISLPLLGSLTGRGDSYVKISLGTRIEIFLDTFDNAKFLPDNFGAGTNTGVLLQNSSGASDAFIADSLYASLLANFGPIGFFGFCSFLIIWFWATFIIDKKELYQFTMVYFLFGATTVIFEAFPANLLMACLLARYAQWLPLKRRTPLVNSL